jgi:hypothetical protein
MNKVFKDFATYIRLHDGYGKPKINFQSMYKLFPDFEFSATERFGQYFHFGEAFGYKDYAMVVINGKFTCYMNYKEYTDVDENAAYVS